MFLRFLSSAALCALVFALSACSDLTIDYDGGVDGGIPREARALTLLSEPRLALTGGDTALVQVLLTDADGVPVADADLSFALEGRADDSSLEDLSARTGVDGVAEMTLMAGSTPSAFRVRVGAEDAANVYVDVSVSDAGFGRLAITPEYEGMREFEAMTVTLFIGAVCTDESTLESTGDRNQALTTGESEILFVGLPAATPLAAVGRIRSAEGVVLARGCVDGIEVTAMETLEARVPIHNRPLAPVGSYGVVTGFDADSVALAEELDGVTMRSLPPAGEMTAILDSAEATLRAAGRDDDASRLAAERREGLDERLMRTAADVGPSAALAELTNRVADELAHIEVRGVLRVGEDSGPRFDLERVAAGAERAEPFDPETTGLEVPASLDARVTDDGMALLIENLEIGLRASGLVRAIAARAATDVGLEDGGAWLLRVAGCDGLIAEVESACDTACLIAACEQVTGLALERFEGGLEELDSRRSSVDLSGVAELQAVDGDLVVDRVDGALDGLWVGEGSGSADAIEAAFVGERIRPPS